MNADGSSCAKIDAIDAGPTTGNGLLIHNFDPVYSPPGADGIMRIVFASTRGNVNNPGAYDYTGPQRMPSDPTKPNSDLFVLEPDPNNLGQMRVRQLTYQLDMEREPSFMSDGRIVFTAEKREQDFYELALRRLDLDGTDYHPLYSQRGSIGYYEATNVVELADKDFATIFSNPGDERTERYAFNARTFADMAVRGHQLNMQGLTVWSEVSDYVATAELSYLAFSRFCWTPTLSWAQFVSDELAPRLGGESAANRFIALAEELDANRTLPAARLGDMQAEALAMLAKLEGEPARRWLTLGESIARRRHMGR